LHTWGVQREWCVRQFGKRIAVKDPPSGSVFKNKLSQIAKNQLVSGADWDKLIAGNVRLQKLGGVLATGLAVDLHACDKL
jgi:hypothetical protein